MPIVTRFNVTPVKSTALHHPEEIMLERYGVPGNRQFFVIDEKANRISATRLAPLMRVVADYEPGREHLSLGFPDGSLAAGDASSGAERYITDMWGRDVGVHVVRGEFADALSEYLGRPVRLVRCDLNGDGNDVRAVTLVSNSSVEELARRGGHDGRLDPGRFRMTIEIGGCEPHEEDSWNEKRVRAGEAILRVERPVPRCVVTTWNPATGTKDFETLKVIGSYRERVEDGLPFGVYASVEGPGTVRVGDPVEPL